MKHLRYIPIILAAVLALTFAGGCAKADKDFVHTSSTISSIDIRPAGGGAEIAGYINEDTGEILFPIPKQQREKYDLTRLMVKASLPYDAYCVPSLTGLKDLSDPYIITVYGGEGEHRTYTLLAYYTRR